ncbi:Uncharacterised protein [Vibrio cholerae]|nr:Uncharacterised protein [Vibrio cholerae]
MLVMMIGGGNRLFRFLTLIFPTDHSFRHAEAFAKA